MLISKILFISENSWAVKQQNKLVLVIQPKKKANPGAGFYTGLLLYNSFGVP